MGTTSNLAQQSDQDKTIPLSPKVAVDKLNALDLGVKFEVSPDGAHVRSKLDEKQADNFQGKQGNNPLTVGQLFGSNFKIQGEESQTSKEVKSRTGFGLGRIADIGSKFLKKDPYLESTGSLKEADIALIAQNQTAIREVNQGSFESAAKDYTAVHASAGGDLGTSDPAKIVTIQSLDSSMADPSMGARAGSVTFKAVDGKIEAKLTDQQAANLERVLADSSFSKQSELFRTDQIAYDSATKTVQVNDNVAKADLDRFAAGGNKLLQDAIDSGNPKEVNGLKHGLNLGPIDQQQRDIRKYIPSGIPGNLHGALNLGGGSLDESHEYKAPSTVAANQDMVTKKVAGINS